ncbi:hypothetical protein P4B35_17165 [Pontiellaceae bacterium B12227]|nr:hypothetical protein [Pontiellaceae bacterium B12227]
MKKLMLSLWLFSAACVQAGVVNVANHGIVPGKDASGQVNRLLQSLEGKKGVTLSFPRGPMCSNLKRPSKNTARLPTTITA